MGKKGKNKNQTPNIQNPPISKNENTDKEEKKQESVKEVPKVEELKVEPVNVDELKAEAVKVEELKVEPEKNEALTEECNESKDGTLKSKKRRNRKKKNPATGGIESENIEESKEETNLKEELQTPNQDNFEPSKENTSVEALTDTLKKKRRRNKKKNVTNVGDVQEEGVKEITKEEPPVEISNEKSGEDTSSSQQNTLKRKRNRNKNKTGKNKDQNESIVEAVEKPIETVQPQQIEAKCEQNEKPETQRRGKKQKRFDLSSKKTISDELQERQEREQKEARDHIKNEIAKREKLLETIDLVLDCHKTEVELAKNQQESLKDVKMLSQEASKIRPQALPLKTPKQSSKKSTPVEDELTNKIEQVLGMTKLEIKNAQTQQAYVNRLEAEVAKVKQSKDILLGGQSSSVVPPHIQKMAKEMRDIGKGDIPKTKEELIKEIESRDTLMSEINRVLDNTKSEISKVQKQQKIIQNLEVELNKMKDQEIVEKLICLEQEEVEEEEEPQEPPPPKQSPATASLLDALMANVGKLKEIQAMKEKQKAEKTTTGVSKETIPQEIPESIQKPVISNDVGPIVETNVEVSSSVALKQETDPLKSSQNDGKNNDKKQPSSEGPLKEQKKHPKDQKKQPQKVHEAKPKAEVLTNSENQKDEILTKIDSVKECGSVKDSEKTAPMDVDKSKTEVKEPTKQEKSESPKKEHQKKNDHNKDVRKSEKGAENKKVTETTSSQQKNVDSVNQKKNNDKKIDVKNIEISVPDQKKIKSLEAESDKKVKDLEQVVPVEAKTIISDESATKQLIKSEDSNDLNAKVNDQKKNDKEHKMSPKNSHKNRNHKHEKKDVLKGVPEVISPIPITAQKPSMADMLKNAPDPPPDEINKEVKVEAAPLARPESAIIEVKPSEQIKEIVQPIMKEACTQEKNTNEVAKDSDDPSKKESEIQDDEIVIVNKVEIEAEIKEEKLNEQDFTDPKNVQRGGFVSPVDDKDAKSLKKDEKQQANKVKSPIKASSRSSVQKVSDGKATQQNKTTTPKPKLEVQAKVNSKPTDGKKMPQSPTKPLSPTLEKPQPKFENANSVSNDIPSSPNIDTKNTSHDISPSSTDKPKIPPRPDVTKTNNTKPALRAGNVTNQPSSPIKTKTPSPSKSPSVAKQAATSTAQSQTNAARPKPTVSQTRQSATSKPPINTKSTNQKPLATPQKVNSTKTSTPKSSSSMCDSVFRLQQLKQNNIYNKKTFSQPAFRIKIMDEKSMNPIKRPLTTSNSDNNTNQMKALLTKDGTIKIILPSTLTGNLQENFSSKDVTETSSSKSQNENPPTQLFNKKGFLDNENDESSDSLYSEYKITPRQIFSASICQVCKVNLSRYFLCNECKMVAYCKEEHMKIDYLNHKGLCIAIQLIAKRRGGHVYNMAKHLASMEFRHLRLHTICLCEQFLNRALLTFEREVFLFPRLCHHNKCREWRSNILSDCEKCGQISYCSKHPMNESHKLICNSYALFQRILLHEKSYGKINIALPQKVLKKIPTLTGNVQDIMQLLYKNVTAFQDECINAALMQIATTPLTTFYSIQNVGFEFMERVTIHFVGAELKFEADRLEKWESLFLHLAHGVTDLQIIFIGSELNYENLPVEIISRTRVCKICRQNCCGIRFDFQCKQFYHDYCESTAFVKPDFVCFLNPALHRAGFRGFDTWPKTIEAALKTASPILVTSTTENECYLDLNTIKKVSNNEIEILIPPIKNPYASTRPERNFASDDEDPIMFKNNYLFVIAKTPDLIDL